MKSMCYLLALIALVSCGKKKESKPSAVQYFRTGDPEQFVRGTKNNSQSLFEIDKLDQFAGHSVGISIFSEKALLKEGHPSVGTSVDDEDESTQKFANFSFKELDGKLTYSSDWQDYISFEFEAENETARLTELNLSGNIYPVQETYHYSIKDDESAFSILFRIEEPGALETILVSAVFTKEASSLTRTKGQHSFNFLGGNDRRIRWRDSINLKVCYDGNYSFREFLLSSAEASLDLWLEDIDIPHSVELLKDYPPFSDLNTQCLYLVEDVLRSADDREVNMAAALNRNNVTDEKILDGDIFIWKKEYEKFRVKEKWADTFQTEVIIQGEESSTPTITHEMGHFLGLGHKFDGTSSVMSYEDQDCSYWSKGRGVLCDYDVKAINALYK